MIREKCKKKTLVEYRITLRTFLLRDLNNSTVSFTIRGKIAFSETEISFLKVGCRILLQIYL